MHLFRNNDLLLGVFVLAITAMLLLPLPTPVLDLLLVLNLSISLLLLLVGLYMPNAVALLAFPSLLLLTTLFRLGLNVASTRLILSQADAGQVIHAFGNFLIRGEVIVGVIIFTIITVVNYIVIAKGSSRVSEVAARFALDALPGKQMAIDADLRAGLITPQQAEEKREELRKESQLYGSMDGAMKFVQGDAIAGFFIIFTNILGGLYIGISQGMDLGQAVQTYTTLTVGDGLVSQIPALFISICAGVVVTRVASKEGATLGSDLKLQLFSRPATLAFAGTMLVILGLFPALPVLPFLVVGLFFILLSVVIKRQQAQAARDRDFEVGLSPGTTSLMLPDTYPRGDTAINDSRCVVFLDPHVLYPLYLQREAAFREWSVNFSADFNLQTGLRLPNMQFRSNADLSAGKIEINLNGSFVHADSVMLDAIFVEMNPVWGEFFGLTVLKQEQHPISGAMHFWTAQKPSSLQLLRSGIIRYYTTFEYITLLLGRFLTRYPEEALSMSEVHGRIKDIETRYPNFLGDALDTDYFSLSRITQVVHELVREGINVYQLKGILEQLASYASSYGSSLVRENEFDLDDIVAFIRRVDRRKILHNLQSERGRVKVIGMSDQLQEIFSSSTTYQVEDLKVSANSHTQGLLKGLQHHFEMARNFGQPPICLICPPELRFRVSRFLRDIDARITVISKDELDASIDVELVGVW